MDRARDPRAGRRSPVARRRRDGPAARLARRLRPPRTLRPTRAGWSFFAITFGVGFAALNTGNNLLYLVLSLMLAFLVLSGALSESALRGIQVRRQLPGELFAGLPAAVALVVSNRQRRVPAFAVVVEDRTRGPHGEILPAGRVVALRVAPGGSETRRYRFTPPARGDLPFEGFLVSTRFPFGLFSKSLTLEAPARVLVYPGVERVEALQHLGSTRDEGAGRSGADGSGAVAAGLAPWTPGDSVRRIHWPASLRRRELLARELEREDRREIEVQLQTAGRSPDEAFECAVSWAASEVVAFLEAGARVSLSCGDERIPADAGPGQRARLLSFLARVAPAGAAAT